jgi:hypothetical protein
MDDIPDRFGKGVNYPPPLELSHYIGELIMAFSYSQTAVQFLLWRIMRVTFLDGRALTGRLDARLLIALLEELCGRHLTKPNVKDRASAAIKALSLASQYRNMAAHGEWRTNEKGRSIASPFNTTRGLTQGN